MIVNSTKADMANVLAHPDPPGPSHQIHASDMIARSRPAGMLVRLHGGCQLEVSAIQSDFYLIDLDHKPLLLALVFQTTCRDERRRLR